MFWPITAQKQSEGGEPLILLRMENMLDGVVTVWRTRMFLKVLSGGLATSESTGMLNPSALVEGEAAEGDQCPPSCSESTLLYSATVQCTGHCC